MTQAAIWPTAIYFGRSWKRYLVQRAVTVFYSSLHTKLASRLNSSLCYALITRDMSWSGFPREEPQIRAFDEPFGFMIRHIEVVPNVHKAEPRFQLSGRWKPPTRTTGVKVIQDVQYLSGQHSLSQHTKFVWRPPQRPNYGGPPTQSVSRMQLAEEQSFLAHKSATLFWATDSHTLLHVPFDCTLQDVEPDPLLEDSEYEDDQRTRNETTGTNPHGSPKPISPLQGQERRETWRRLRFFHRYPGAGQPTISVARYDGGNTQLGGKLPQRWNSTLISPTHRPEEHCVMDCQLAGDLPILLGLVATCHANKNAAIAAVNKWFPPSKGTSQWMDPAIPDVETHMQRMEHSTFAFIETHAMSAVANTSRGDERTGS